MLICAEQSIVFFITYFISKFVHDYPFLGNALYFKFLLNMLEHALASINISSENTTITVGIIKITEAMDASMNALSLIAPNNINVEYIIVPSARINIRVRIAMRSIHDTMLDMN